MTTFFPPLNSIASLRPYSWAKYWTLAGHHVTVLTTAKQHDSPVALSLPNPGFEVIEISMPKFLSFLKKSYQATNTARSETPFFFSAFKQKLLALFNHVRNKKGIFNSCRMPDFSDLWIRPAFRAIQNQRRSWDLVVSSAGPYSVHVVAERIKKDRLARQWIADYRDTWTDNYHYPGLFPFTLIEKKWEKKLMQHADAIVTVNGPLAESLGIKYGSEKTHVIENGFDSCDLEYLDPRSIFEGSGKFHIVHTGTFYKKCDPTPLFQAIRLLKQDGHDGFLDRLEVLFVGSNLGNLDKLIADYQVGQWVRIKGFVSREEALRMQRDAHALLFLPLNEMPIEGIVPGKLFEYLFSGTPVLAIGGQQLEDSQKLILESGCGVVLAQVEEIIDFLKLKLKTLLKDSIMHHSNLLKRFERKFLAMKLLDLV